MYIILYLFIRYANKYVHQFFGQSAKFMMPRVSTKINKAFDYSNDVKRL